MTCFCMALAELAKDQDAERLKPMMLSYATLRVTSTLLYAIDLII